MYIGPNENHKIKAFFNWIKITDSFKVKLIIFGFENDSKKQSILLKKICKFDAIKKALII